MKILQNTAYLCGHFTTPRWRDLANGLAAAGWQADTLDDTHRTEAKNYYYAEFIDFAYHSVAAKGRGGLQQGPDGIVRFRRDVNAQVAVGVGEGRSVAVDVRSLQLCLAPFGIVLFSVAMAMHDLEYNDMARALLTMRDLCRYDRQGAGPFVEAALRPVYDAYRLTHSVPPLTTDGEGPINLHMLAENGNKLKLFQIIETTDINVTTTGSATFDRALYTMGCLAPMNTLPDTGRDHDVYYDRVMEAGKVAVFDDWRALALFDSFTILAAELPDFRRHIWTSDYFGLIFLYSLFHQAFLLRYDAHFRAYDCDIKRLEADILLFERRYRYDRFSYNFLPLELSHAMERALELPDSSDNLHNMVTQASAVYDKESDDKMNRVLTLLTVITICSTVWDLFSLIDAAGCFHNAASGFRMGIGVLVLVLLTICLIFLQSRRRKR